ncbi:bifunctional ornithine acetyltransferase/N-acetylglutamate synthase [Cellulosilyticum sp. I15G10I2]|uniref:bifunctional ornithine acetyltransferase/N-acetylglutamate synthase n=1 Tax=Cellulosilyticum sp. I15G10I2 TaxID=1892843 RepID=UPI00085C14BD|nr:bifunctional ornithine acetyltransferase/N-acetylglutamate synthase [Cellulosilyticum sp. I15G10I2]
MKLIQGGITAAKGFKAAGEYIGIKNKRKDLAIVYSETGCIYAGAFTQNVVKAAPVIWDQKVLESGNKVHAIVVNSGNANAATGEKGFKDTEEMALTTAEAFDVQKEEVLVCSTGVIGVELPMAVIKEGIKKVAPKVSEKLESANNAAEAILTTDTASKTIAIQQNIGNVTVNIGGMGKGSGMIHPNMATMLGFITTDVNITQPMLQKALKKAIDTTFNMITVDGDTSTNDSVLVLASGLAGNALIDTEGEDYDKFFESLYEVCKYIAISIVKDGEGATKLLEVSLTGAGNFEDGKALAKSVLTSSLVKTAFFGEDANWGRIFCAMGYSGVKFDPSTVDIAVESIAGHVSMLKQGLPVKFSEAKAKEVLQENEIKILITMQEGSTAVTAWGCDLSYDYVKINGDYRS